MFTLFLMIRAVSRFFITAPLPRQPLTEVGFLHFSSANFCPDVAAPSQISGLIDAAIRVRQAIQQAPKWTTVISHQRCQQDSAECSNQQLLPSAESRRGEAAGADPVQTNHNLMPSLTGFYTERYTC